MTCMPKKVMLFMQTLDSTVRLPTYYYNTSLSFLRLRFPDTVILLTTFFKAAKYVFRITTLFGFDERNAGCRAPTGQSTRRVATAAAKKCDPYWPKF